MENTLQTDSIPAGDAGGNPEEAPVAKGAPEPVVAETAPAETAPPPTDIDRLIAEAEQRGYMRGRNERIHEAMQQPALWENLRRPAAEAAAGDADSPISFLSGLRPGVWD